MARLRFSRQTNLQFAFLYFAFFILNLGEIARLPRKEAS